MIINVSEIEGVGSMVDCGVQSTLIYMKKGSEPYVSKQDVQEVIDMVLLVDAEARR